MPKASRRDALKSAGLGLGLLFGSSTATAQAATTQAATASARGVEGQRRADLGDGRFLNPIMAGDHPDPSILKDGSDYYMTFSTFEAYPGLVAVAGATSVQVPVLADGRHDLPAMAAAIGERTRVVIVCTPNNPTSTIVTAAEFAEFMIAVPDDVLVLLDEAYVEFVTDAAAVKGTDVLHRYPNVVVLRTFSKAYGLAGLRIGYAIGAAYILDAARTTAIPMSVTTPSQHAALVSLDHEDALLERVARLTVLRELTWQSLIDQGWSVPKPQGNFVWLQTGEATEHAAEVFAAHGIVGRPLGSDGIRISIGESQSVDKLLKASAEVVRDLPSTVSGARLD